MSAGHRGTCRGQSVSVLIHHIPAHESQQVNVYSTSCCMVYVCSVAEFAQAGCGPSRHNRKKTLTSINIIWNV